MRTHDVFQKSILNKKPFFINARNWSFFPPSAIWLAFARFLLWAIRLAWARFLPSAIRLAIARFPPLAIRLAIARFPPSAIRLAIARFPPSAIRLYGQKNPNGRRQKKSLRDFFWRFFKSLTPRSPATAVFKKAGSTFSSMYFESPLNDYPEILPLLGVPLLGIIAFFKCPNRIVKGP